MSCDKLVFDLASETEGSPNVFVRKDWLNILDNQNRNYNSNQSVIDTSQLSNSNKWMSYREAYIEVPLLLTLGCDKEGAGTKVSAPVDPGTGWSGGIFGAGAIGLKNWFGNIVHSFTLDYNGTTIVQQTPFVNMWNSFKLMTTLSWGDVATQGAHIGFYPDVSDSFTFSTAAAAAGDGICNNGLYNISYDIVSEYTTPDFTENSAVISGHTGKNSGYARRLSYIAYTPNASLGGGTTNESFITNTLANQMWRSYINGRSGAGTVLVGTKGFVQYQTMATIYLKHIHSFFNMCPLLKGVYMKMTLNLNNSSCVINAKSGRPTITDPYNPGELSLVSSSNAVGGVVPFMISSAFGSESATGVAFNQFSGGAPLTSFVGADQKYYANLSVGSVVLDPAMVSACSLGLDANGKLGESIYLYVPAYTFNPVFEQAYLSSPVKTVKYTDVYQYQVQGINKGQSFNALVTNGIANIKSVLVLPFVNPESNGTIIKKASFQSPFNPAGCGPTDPLMALNNFNVVISGQNAIYNTERYTFEHFVNQVYGQNAVNGGLTDGLTSSLINFKDFQSSYCYYYTNVERMLPVEQSVPKSVQLIGNNQTELIIDLWVFVEYGVQIMIDSITGARV